MTIILMKELISEHFASFFVKVFNAIQSLPPTWDWIDFETVKRSAILFFARVKFPSSKRNMVRTFLVLQQLLHN